MLERGRKRSGMGQKNYLYTENSIAQYNLLCAFLTLPVFITCNFKLSYFSRKLNLHG